jgi:hypothetical protein
MLSNRKSLTVQLVGKGQKTTTQADNQLLIKILCLIPAARHFVGAEINKIIPKT